MATPDADRGGSSPGVDAGESGTKARREYDPSLGALVRVVARKRVILLTRYPVNTAAKLVSLYVLFALVFYGGQAVAGPALSDSLDGILVGFFLYTLVIVSYTGLAMNVTREAQWGTLERLYMSPHGFGTVMAVKTLVNVGFSFLGGTGILVAMMLTTGRWLSVDPLTVVPLGLATLAPVVGIGFLFAGLALVYKRVESAFGLVQFVFVGLIAAPVETYGALRLLPVSHGSYLLRRAMTAGVHLWEFPAWELALLAATGVGYLLAGYYCFHLASHRARREGLLGQY